MASIGNFSFHQWRIAMPREVRPKLPLQRRSGVAQRVLVRGDRQMESAAGWTATICASRAAAQTLIVQHLALVSSTQVVSVVDQFGFTFPYVTPMTVRHDLTDQIGGTARVDAYWTLDVGFLT